MSATRTLWRNGDFMKLWGAQAISVFGSQVTLLAMPLTAILLLHASPFEVGLLATAQYLPYLVFGLPAGALVDRMPRRVMLITTDLGRALLLLAVPVAAAWHVLNLGLLLAVAFSVGALSMLFDAAHQAYLPSLVSRGQLLEGNAKLELSYSGARFGGAGVGGVLVQLLSAPVALLVDAASYLGSAALLLLIRHHEPAQLGDRATRPRIVAAIQEGLRYVFRHELIRPIALTQALSGFFDLFGVAGAVLTLFAVRELDVSPAALGLLVAMISGGSVLGALANRWVIRRLGLGQTLVWTALLTGVALLAMPLASPRTALLVIGSAMLVVGLCNGLFDVSQISLRQAVTPAALQGRMNATVRFLIWGLMPAGSFVGGLLGEVIGLRLTLFVAGLGSLLQVVPILLSRVRAMFELPNLAPDSSPAGGLA